MLNRKSLLTTALHRMSGFVPDRRGSAVSVFALCLIPMALAAGGAVDFTRYYDARENVQTALDAATLAGAAIYDGSNGTAAGNLATKTFSSWNTSVDGNIATPSFTPASSSGTLDLTGTAEVSFNMYFLGLIGISTLDFTVTSKAERTAQSSSDGAGCVWFKTSGMLMNSSETLSAPECRIYNLAGSVMLNSSVTITTPKLCISSSSSVTNNGATVVDSDGSDSLEKDCTTSDAPDLPTAPTFSCDNKVTDVKSTYDYNSYPSVTLKPGIYCQSVTFNGGSSSSSPQKVTLEPGMYILSGSTFIFDANTTVTGSGVTFYFADSSSYLQFNSKVISTLSAPTSGDCEDTDSCGVLMYEASGLSKNTLAPFDSSTDSEWTGDINLPSWYVQQNSHSYINLAGNLVLNGLTLNSSSVWNISPGTNTSTSSTYSDPRLVQ